MSADNFILVCPRGDKFVVIDNLSASMEYDKLTCAQLRAHSTHDGLVEALVAAHKLDRAGYYEYGVQVSHEVQL
jgi:hypothetical protein